MKKMKKIMVIALSAIMVFALAATAFAADYITKDQAKQAAIDAVNAQFNTQYTIDSLAAVKVERPEYDDDSLKVVYDVEFYIDNGDGTYLEYDCDIDAQTGELVGRISFEIERDLDDIPLNGDSIFAKLKALIDRIIEFIKNLFKGRA